jgi:hypothetical protein
MGLRRIPEFNDQRMLIERALDDSTLNTFAAAVDEANFSETGFVRRVDVFLDDRLDVARSKGVKVQAIFDRDAVRHG